MDGTRAHFISVRFEPRFELVENRSRERLRKRQVLDSRLDYARRPLEPNGSIGHPSPSPAPPALLTNRSEQQSTPASQKRGRAPQRADADDGAISDAQGAGRGRSALLSHGRLFRTVLRRRQESRRRARHRADLARRASGRADSDVRRARAQCRRLSCAADQGRLARRHRRAGPRPRNKPAHAWDRRRWSGVRSCAS